MPEEEDCPAGGRHDMQHKITIKGKQTWKCSKCPHEVTYNLLPPKEDDDSGN